MSELKQLRELLRKLKSIGQIEDGEGRKTFEQIVELVKSGKIDKNEAWKSISQILSDNKPDGKQRLGSQRPNALGGGETYENLHG